MYAIPPVNYLDREAEKLAAERGGSLSLPMSLTSGTSSAPPLELTVVMPCLNEELTVGICVEKAVRTMRELGVAGEVVVVDNGSTDRSVEIATAAGAAGSLPSPEGLR